MENELKQFVIDAQKPEDFGVTDTNCHDALFNDELGLNSSDALELGLAIRKKDNVKVDADKEGVVKVFFRFGFCTKQLTCAF